MKKASLILCMIGLLAIPILGQSPEKIAAITKKVIGKWTSIDKTSYIVFLPDGSCSAGDLFPGGKWQVEHFKLEMWQQGDDFRCGSGGLTLTGPNTIARDYGMGGKPIVYHRVPAGAPAAR
jgi:hypothetical protein